MTPLLERQRVERTATSTATWTRLQSPVSLLSLGSLHYGPSTPSCTPLHHLPNTHATQPSVSPFVVRLLYVPPPPLPPPLLRLPILHGAASRGPEQPSTSRRCLSIVTYGLPLRAKGPDQRGVGELQRGRSSCLFAGPSENSLLFLLIFLFLACTPLPLRVLHALPSSARHPESLLATRIRRDVNWGHLQVKANHYPLPPRSLPSGEV